MEQQRLGDAMERALGRVIDEDVLRLIFTARRPMLPAEGCVALTLRLIGALRTAEIAEGLSGA